MVKGNATTCAFYVLIQFFTIVAVPVYFWPLLKTTAGQTRGTDHAEPHGNVRQVQGGIELNGVDAWLDGGDFHGRCFSDPDLCIKGLSVAMQVCLNCTKLT